LAAEYDAVSYVARIAKIGGYKEYGILLGAVGRWGEAAAAFRLAQQEHPADVGAGGDLGVANHALGRHLEAVQAFEDALRHDPAYFERRPTQRRIWEASQNGSSLEP
jgi:Flp pilus assembly protein TadD